jgi:hypothetical protein
MAVDNATLRRASRSGPIRAETAVGAECKTAAGVPRRVWRGICLPRRMNDLTRESDIIDFGELSPAVNELLQKGVAAYRRDPERADQLFREALELSPQELPAYYCLYKIHTYMGNLEVAFAMANLGLVEATRQAGWSTDPHTWPLKETAPGSAERFALYTLKALSFIELKRGNKAKCMENLEILKSVDPRGAVGWTVIFELAQGVA